MHAYRVPDQALAAAATPAALPVPTPAAVTVDRLLRACGDQADPEARADRLMGEGARRALRLTWLLRLSLRALGLGGPTWRDCSYAYAVELLTEAGATIDEAELAVALDDPARGRLTLTAPTHWAIDIMTASWRCHACGGTVTTSPVREPADAGRLVAAHQAECSGQPVTIVIIDQSAGDRVAWQVHVTNGDTIWCRHFYGHPSDALAAVDYLLRQGYPVAFQSAYRELARAAGKVWDDETVVAPLRWTPSLPVTGGAA